MTVEFKKGRIAGLLEAKEVCDKLVSDANALIKGAASLSEMEEASRIGDWAGRTMCAFEIEELIEKERVELASIADAPEVKALVDWNKRVDRVCLIAAELRSIHDDDKAQVVIDKIRGILESAIPPSFANFANSNEKRFLLFAKKILPSLYRRQYSQNEKSVQLQLGQKAWICT